MQVSTRRTRNGVAATAAFATVLATVLAIGLALGTPVAQATTRHHTDATQDVTRATYGSDGSVTMVQDPRKRDGDVVSFTMWHRRRVGVTIGFADLKRFGVKLEDLRMVTNEGVKRDAIVVAADGYWRGEGWVERPNGDAVTGCSLRKHLDYRANTVTVSVSRRCLSFPRWVRIGFMDYDSDLSPGSAAGRAPAGHLRSLLQGRGSSADDQVTFVDDAMKNNSAGNLVPNLSARLYRQ